MKDLINNEPYYIVGGEIRMIKNDILHYCKYNKSDFKKILNIYGICIELIYNFDDVITIHQRIKIVNEMKDLIIFLKKCNYHIVKIQPNKYIIDFNGVMFYFMVYV